MTTTTTTDADGQRRQSGDDCWQTRPTVCVRDTGKTMVVRCDGGRSVVGCGDGDGDERAATAIDCDWSFYWWWWWWFVAAVERERTFLHS